MVLMICMGNVWEMYGKCVEMYCKYMVISFIELDDGNILTGKPDQFDGKNKLWVSGVDFPKKTNPVNHTSGHLVWWF